MKNENPLCSITIEDTINISHNSFNSKNSLIKLYNKISEKVPNDQKNIIIPKENKSVQENDNPYNIIQEPKSDNLNIPMDEIKEEKETTKEKNTKTFIKPIPFFDDNQNDIYSNLLKEEQKFEAIPLYGYMDNQPYINEIMRRILVNWLIDIHYKFNLREETLYQTIWIIDAYLSKEKIDIKYLQLLGISAFFISLKENETFFPTLYTLVLLVDNAYKKEEIVEFELKILKVLDFNILAPTSYNFYKMISMAFNFDKSLFFFGKYFLDTCLIDYQMNKYPSSVIGISCVYIVMKFFGIDNYEELFSQGVIKDDNPEKVIKDAAKDIHLLLKNLDNNPSLQAVKNKYSSVEYLDVADLFDI